MKMEIGGELVEVNPDADSVVPYRVAAVVVLVSLIVGFFLGVFTGYILYAML